MATKQTYEKNKPLVNAVLTGAFYFLFCWSIDFGDGVKILFMTVMLFLPGLTFPLTTCYYNSEKSAHADIRKIIHLLLSVLIYHESVWLFSAEGRIKYITVVAGFSGSLFFLLTTKYLLKKGITWLQIALTSVLSGLAFMWYESLGRLGVFMGLAVFLWTVINGIILNIEYRKARYTPNTIKQIL